MAFAPTTNFRKDPDAERPFMFDWSRYLAPTGDTIDSVSITTTGMTEGSISNTDTLVTVWVSGGSANTTGSIECEVTTTNGITDQITATFTIDDH